MKVLINNMLVREEAFLSTALVTDKIETKVVNKKKTFVFTSYDGQSFSKSEEQDGLTLLCIILKLKNQHACI